MRIGFLGRAQIGSSAGRRNEAAMTRAWTAA